jgi:hypothetical protein
MKYFINFFTALVVTLGFVIVPCASAEASSVPFVLVIDSGLVFDFNSVQYSDSHDLSVYTASGAIHPVVNGKKGGEIWGTANVIVWSRDVPDPLSFFAPLGPVAALVTLEFPNPQGGYPLLANLGLIQAPSGLQTTIGVIVKTGQPSIRGNWVIADGTIIGSSASDLVIGGLLLVGTPVVPSPGNHFLTLSQYWPYFAYDSHPTSVECQNTPQGSICPGSFYGQTFLNGQFRPVRSYTVYKQSGIEYGKWAHLMAINAGGDGYYVVACADYNNKTAFDPDAIDADKCTLSGTGQLTDVTGNPAYLAGASLGQWYLNLVNYFVMP